MKTKLFCSQLLIGLKLIYIGCPYEADAFWCVLSGNKWENMENSAATAGLGKYHIGGYGRIGVYGVNYTWRFLYNL